MTQHAASSRPPSDPGPGRTGRVLALAARVALALVVAALGGWLALRQPAVATWAVNALLARVPTPPRATIRVAAARGDWISRLELRGLRVSRGDTLLAGVDTVRIGYRIASVLAGRIEVSDLAISGLAMNGEAADTTHRPASGRPLTLADIARGRFYHGPSLWVDRLSVSGARGVTAAAGPLAALRVSTGTLRASGLRLGSGFSFRIDSLGLRVAPASDTGRVASVRLSAALDSGRFALRSFGWRSEGGEVRADGLASFDARDSLTGARLALKVRPLAWGDLAALVPGLGLRGSITADVDLRGTRADRLSGTVAARVDGAWAPGWGPTWLEGTLKDGGAQVRFASVYEGANFHGSGWIRPFDARPTYDLGAELERLPGRIPGAPWWNAAAARAGERARLRVAGGGYADAAFEVTAEFDGASGQLDLDGRLALAPRIAWDLRRLSFADLDIARLVGDTVSSAANGTARGRGWVGADGAVRTEAALSLGPSSYGRWRIERGEARAMLAGFRLGAAIDVRTDLGRLEVDSLSGRWDGDGAFRADGVRFQGLDLARLTGQESLPTRVDGALRLVGRGLSRMSGDGGPVAALRDGRLSGRIDLDLDLSRDRRADLGRGSARVVVEGGRARLDADLESSAGRVALQAETRPFDAPPRVTRARARFDDVDVAAWTGSGPPTALSGSLDASGQAAGRSGSAAEWTAALRLGASRVGAASLDGGNADVSLADGRLRVTAALRAGGDTASARIDAALSDSLPRGRVACSVPLGLAAAIAGRESLATRGSIDLAVTFAGAAPATLAASGTLRGSGAIGRARLDSLAARFNLVRGMLVLDTLVAGSNVGRFRGGGRAALADTTASTDLRLTLDLDDASPLRPLLGLDTLSATEGTVRVRVGGTAAERSLDVAAGFPSVTWNALWFLDASAEARATLDRGWRLASGEGRVTLRRFQGAGLLLGETSAHATHDRGVTSFELTASHDERHRLRAAGRSRPDSLGVALVLAALDIRDGPVAWRLARPAEFAAGAEGFEVRSFELRSPQGRIAARGRMGRRGDQDLRLEAAGVRLGSFAAWLGRDNLDGTLSGSLTISGPAGSPSGRAAFLLDLVSGEHPAGSLNARLDLAEDRLRIDGQFRTPAGDSLVMSGHVPVSVSLAASDSVARMRVHEGNVELRAVARGFPLAALSPFLDPNSIGEPSGVLDMDARLAGTSRTLEGDGRVELANATLPLPGLGVTLQGLRFRGTLEGDRLVVGELRAQSGKGTLEASGDIRFAGITRIEPRLDIRSRRFLVVRTTALRATASGHLTVAGTLTAPVVRGTVSVEDGFYQFTQSDLAPSAAAEVTLTDADRRMMEETFGFVARGSTDLPTRIYGASDLDLTVTLARNNWVRQRVEPRMAVGLTGDAHIQKPPHADPRLFGRIELIPDRGYVEQFARSFDIAGGGVVLNGDMKDHLISVQAQYQPPTTSVTVKLYISGTPEHLKLTLSSEPAMSQGDIVSFIATGHGQGSGGPAPGAGDASVSLARDLGLAQITGAAGTAVQEATGLDVVQVRYDALQGAALVAGRYLDPRLYVGFQQPLQYKESGSALSGTVHRTNVEVEYAIQRWLVLNLKAETSKVRSFIRVRHAF